MFKHTVLASILLGFVMAASNSGSSGSNPVEIVLDPDCAAKRATGRDHTHKRNSLKGSKLSDVAEESDSLTKSRDDKSTDVPEENESVSESEDVESSIDSQATRSLKDEEDDESSECSDSGESERELEKSVASIQLDAADGSTKSRNASETNNKLEEETNPETKSIDVKEDA